MKIAKIRKTPESEHNGDRRYVIGMLALELNLHGDPGDHSE